MRRTMSETRRVECWECGAEVVCELQSGFDGPDVHCPGCGVRLSDNALAKTAALERGLSVERAAQIALRYTHEQIMDMARKAMAGNATSDEIDAITAFCLLRDLGLPCHADPKPN